MWSLRTGCFLRNLVSLESGGSGGVVWRIRASNTKLVCAVGSRNGTEETKLLVLDFDVDEQVATSQTAQAVADVNVDDVSPALSDNWWELDNSSHGFKMHLHVHVQFRERECCSCVP